MKRQYIDIIEISQDELNGSIDEIIDRKLKAYEGKCFNNTFITKVLAVVSRGRLNAPRNVFEGKYQCHVKFEAEYRFYAENELIMLTVTDIKQNKLICEAPEYIAVATIRRGFEPKVGNSFIAAILKISYKQKDKVAIIAIPYKARDIVHVFKIAGADGIVPQGLINCVKELKKLKPADVLKHYEKPVKKRAKLFDKYTITDYEKALKVQDHELYFIIDGGEPFSAGGFYISPIVPEKTLAKLGKYHIVVEPVSLETKLFRFAASVYNYLKVAEELNSTVKKGDNAPVWKFLK